MPASDNFSRRRAFTYLACATILAVSSPFVAQAATGSATNVTDPVNANYKARVSSAGQLSVRVGNAVTVGGVVTARQSGTWSVDVAPPAHPFSFTSTCVATGACGDTFAGGPGASSTYNISSISVANPSSIVTTVTLKNMCTTGGGPNPGDTVGPTLVVPATETREITFPQPFQLSRFIACPGSFAALVADWTGNTNATVTIVGYAS